ncbi:MAG: FKBP-type peptidyl-prolyl cis-trans isomerase [Paludibacteraceae bacterium]|nr:FKBP-type peptidyl-prolyl cis-trans isomerase [Paludibacteraceae bacterium]
MKKSIFIWLLTAVVICLPSCKENKWIDWKIQNEMWLDNNLKSDTAVHVTSSGLQYKIIADPTPQDARPSLASTITCDYTCKLINGYVVDGGHATLSLSNCISGFAEGCKLVHNNGDIQFFVPYYLGYDLQKVKEKDEYNAEGHGTEGTQAFIPPYSTLIYDVHICAVSGN